MKYSVSPSEINRPGQFARPVVFCATGKYRLPCKPSMSPSDSFMLRFVREFRGWSDRIRKATYAETVVFSRVPEGAEVTVRWKNRDKTEGSYSKVFTLEELLGNTRHLSSHAWSLEKKYCACARDMISGALNSRGIG